MGNVKTIDTVLRTVDIDAIPMADVDGSSSIARMGHSRGTLVVDFRSGKRYVYNKVPARLFDRMMAQDSVGSFFAAHVRTAFEYSEV